MKKRLAVCALGLFPLFSTALMAEEAGQETNNKLAGFALSGNLALVNDYISRGLSGSDHGPAMQGTLNLNHDAGLYFGLFGTNVDLNDGDGSSLELDLSGGYTREWKNGTSIDFGLIQYVYPKAPAGVHYDYREYYLGTGYKLMDTSLKAKYYYSDAYMGNALGGQDHSASYLDTQVSYEIAHILPFKTTLKGHFGRAFGDYVKTTDRLGPKKGISGFNDYSIGAAAEFSAGLGLELNYIGVDNNGRELNSSSHADDRLALSLSKSF